jgi:hypothetical protein
MILILYQTSTDISQCSIKIKYFIFKLRGFPFPLPMQLPFEMTPIFTVENDRLLTPPTIEASLYGQDGWLLQMALEKGEGAIAY